MPTGHLYIVGTPIGNLEDITLRALRVLREADLIACEDTQQTQKLLHRYEIRKSLVSYHEFNERDCALKLILKIQSGKNVALVSDAGMPGISDPGFRIISLAIEKNIPMTPVPGPSALLTALVISGLPTHRFVFEGFLPEKKIARKKHLLDLKDDPRTLIFYESAERLRDSLQDVLEVMGDRSVSVAHELTKKFESVTRGSLKQVMGQLADAVLKGEFVLVISGGKDQNDLGNLSIEDHILQIMEMMEISRKEAIPLVAHLRGLSKREVYQKGMGPR